MQTSNSGCSGVTGRASTGLICSASTARTCERGRSANGNVGHVSKALCDPRAICCAYAPGNTAANGRQLTPGIFAGDRDSAERGVSNPHGNPSGADRQKPRGCRPRLTCGNGVHSGISPFTVAGSSEGRPDFASASPTSPTCTALTLTGNTRPRWLMGNATRCDTVRTRQ
jgi:hypothetical protein